MSLNRNDEEIILAILELTPEFTKRKLPLTQLIAKKNQIKYRLQIKEKRHC
jgi:hypothetical protein